MKLNQLQLRRARAYAKKYEKHASPIIFHKAYSERDVIHILQATVDGHERVAKLVKTWRKNLPLNPTQSRRQFAYDLLACVEQALVGVSDYCRAYHFQDCSNCDDLACCDNTYRRYHPKKRRP